LDGTTGTLTLHDGTSAATLTIIPIDDTSVEGTENAILTVVAAPAYQVGTPGTATITIADNDSPPLPSLSVSDASIIEGRSGKTSKATVTISLSGPSTTPVTVQLKAVDGTATGGVDYGTVSATTITFAPA